MRPPDFWSSTGRVAKAKGALLSPLSALYVASVRLRRIIARPYHARAQVICVGNLSVGGAGKTPAAIAIARLLSERGRSPIFLTRGYGGRMTGPVRVDLAIHMAADVGDEALLLAATYPTIVARDRAKGAALADSLGADVIVMDDGHQNPSLAKDLSLVVVDAEAGFGNGSVIPAGPLREPVADGLARAHAIVLVGDGNPTLPNHALPKMRAHIRPIEAAMFRGERVFAFAGIGRPEKFFATLRDMSATLCGTKEFSDHHVFTMSDLGTLRSEAARLDARLVTTEKDWVRLAPSDRSAIAALPVRAVFDHPEAILDLIDRRRQ